VIIGVGNEQITILIHGNSSGSPEPSSATRAVDATTINRQASNGRHDAIRGDFANRSVSVVSDKDVAIQIYCQSSGRNETCRTAYTIVSSSTARVARARSRHATPPRRGKFICRARSRLNVNV